MVQNNPIRELKIEVNRECPLNCLHCSSNGAPQAPEKLDLSRVVGLIREFADIGGQRLAVSGGEPLLYEGLPNVLSVCISSGIRPDVYTTGIFLSGGVLAPISKAVLNLLKESQAKLVFSVHGASPTTHDLLTQTKGSFETTIDAISRTLGAGVSAKVHIVPTVINIGEIVDMVKLLASMGIKDVSWLRFVPQGRGALNRGFLQLSKEQLKQLLGIRSELQQMCPEVRIRVGSPFNILLPQCPTPCSAGLGVLVIRPDGSAIPCDAFKQFAAPIGNGNIRDHSLRHVWERSELLNAVREMQNARHTSPCAACPQYITCGAGCLAQTALASGRLATDKDPDCLLDQSKVESAETEAVPVL